MLCFDICIHCKMIVIIKLNNIAIITYGYLFICYLLFFLDTGHGAQGLIHTRQTFYH